MLPGWRDCQNIQRYSTLKKNTTNQSAKSKTGAGGDSGQGFRSAKSAACVGIGISRAVLALCVFAVSSPLRPSILSGGLEGLSGSHGRIPISAPTPQFSSPTHYPQAGLSS